MKTLSLGAVVSYIFTGKTAPFRKSLRNRLGGGPECQQPVENGRGRAATPPAAAAAFFTRRTPAPDAGHFRTDVYTLLI